MTVTRYGIYDWSRFSADGSGESEIMEKADGDYVTYDDFKKVLDALSLLNDAARHMREVKTHPEKYDMMESDWGRLHINEENAESILAEFSESE